ncbi:pullulanase [Spirochaeta dissipatitropha]
MKKNFIWFLLLAGLLFFSCGTGQDIADDKAADIQEIPEGVVRVHYTRADGEYENMTLWIWEDTTWESEGGWPEGLSASGTDDYGVYYDIPVAPDASRLGMVVVDRTLGDAGKDGGDKIVEFRFPETRQFWITEGSDDVMLFRPVEIPENTLRVHYVRHDDKYENMTLWTWMDSAWEHSDWPEGMPISGFDEFGAYFDVPLQEDAETLGFLVVDRTMGDPGKDGGDKSFDMLDLYNRVWIQQNDDDVYVTPMFTSSAMLQAATVADDTAITLVFNITDGLSEEDLLEGLSVVDIDGTEVTPESVSIIQGSNTVELTMEIDLTKAPYRVTYDDRTVTARVGWQYVDAQYAYDGWLGPRLNSDGTADIKMWSPMVADVQLVLYDREDQDHVIRDNIQLNRNDNGVWSVQLDSSNTGLASLRGYYYQYLIDADGDGSYRIALDPYASSMAPFNNQIYEIGKAAIIDVASIGPELNYAEIEGFESKTDAIIWEIHVRDFTVDPSIENELNAPFGTFEAAIDKLDYIQSLGVTHVQLLPVMSYKWGDELASREREMEYTASGANYNWGYDPHSYFSVTGMYSADPRDPELRIQELKNLIDAVHARGMGVILDVVYNHTADVRIFEDLAPGYYHFMDSDGRPRTSFGGGRLGTTHAMSRRILVDSIAYWTREFKVDGFRFDMMGDHDAESIQIAYDTAKELNPNIVMIGEGWRTFVGDAGDPRMPADQDWMQHTDSVAVFSDEFRNELKSGFGSEGMPRFITGGARNVQQIFENVKAQPRNFVADQPGDVVPYIAAHDNLTLHDVIAQSIRKDPEIPENSLEIHRRIRIGNAMVLTSQGVAFLHAGQEYGRTKQWRVEGKPEHKETYMVDQDGNPFTYPYFVHDSYDSSDIINMFEWQKATNAELYPEQNLTREYTAGLVALRRSTDAFRLGDRDLVDQNVQKLDIPEIQNSDLAIVYSVEATNGDVYYVFINADSKERTFSLDIDLTAGQVLVDENEAGTTEVRNPSGFSLTSDRIVMDPLTVVVVKN